MRGPSFSFQFDGDNYGKLETEKRRVMSHFCRNINREHAVSDRHFGTPYQSLNDGNYSLFRNVSNYQLTPPNTPLEPKSQNDTLFYAVDKYVLEIMYAALLVST